MCCAAPTVKRLTKPAKLDRCCTILSVICIWSRNLSDIPASYADRIILLRIYSINSLEVMSARCRCDFVIYNRIVTFFTFCRNTEVRYLHQLNATSCAACVSTLICKSSSRPNESPFYRSRRRPRASDPSHNNGRAAAPQRSRGSGSVGGQKQFALSARFLQPQHPSSGETFSQSQFPAYACQQAGKSCA